MRLMIMDSAVRSFEKTPCLAPFLWYNCCEFTIRRRRSRLGRNRFYPAAALKTFLTCAGFAVPTLFARQGSPCGQSSHRQKGFDRSPPLRYHGGSQMSGIAETTERLFGSAVAVSGTGQGETPQSLVTPAFAGFPPIAENGAKAALTT